MYNRCPRNVLEVALYLKDKYKESDLEYADFLVEPPSVEDLTQQEPDQELEKASSDEELDSQ